MIAEPMKEAVGVDVSACSPSGCAKPLASAATPGVVRVRISVSPVARFDTGRSASCFAESVPCAAVGVVAMESSSATTVTWLCVPIGAEGAWL